MASLPSHLSPMLAAPTGALPADLGGWAIEPKWDGVRLIADATGRQVRLWTRNGNDKAPRDVVLEATGSATGALESGMRCAS